MRRIVILPLASLGFAGCVGSAGNDFSETKASGSNASAANQAAVTCDMTEPGGDRHQPTNGDVALIRQQVAWQRIMVDKARVCAEGAGFTGVSRMVERPIGSYVRDAAGQYSRRTEAIWAARGMRGGVPMEIFVTGGGVVTWAPSAPGASGIVTSAPPSAPTR